LCAGVKPPFRRAGSGRRRAGRQQRVLRNTGSHLALSFRFVISRAARHISLCHFEGSETSVGRVERIHSLPQGGVRSLAASIPPDPTDSPSSRDSSACLVKAAGLCVVAASSPTSSGCCSRVASGRAHWIPRHASLPRREPQVFGSY